MPSVRLRELVKTHRLGRQAIKAVDGVTLDAPDGQILTLLGPSGCGKSTTLRCIAGLERPDAGEIAFGDRLVFSRARRVFVPPDRRNVGMVFQSYAIWPHLTVFQNVAFPMEVRGLRRGEIASRVRAALALVGMEALADRPAPYLSGGQQQRVALARALVYEPEVLLLDEPLSNLDAKVREQVREDLRLLQRRLRITTVYVTHDQLEALALSDVVAVMHAGQVVEVGTPQQLYARPRTRFTATFLGEISYFSGPAARRADGSVVVQTPAGALRCRPVQALPDGAGAVVGVRPEHVALSPRPLPAEDNVFAGRVVSALYEGGRVKYRIALDGGAGGASLLAYGEMLLAPGEPVWVHVPPDRVILLPDVGVDATRPLPAPASPA